MNDNVNTDNIKSQMRKGLLEYSILSLLAQGDAYAPALIKALSEAGMQVVEGTLYPLLTREKNQGLLTYRWEESPQGPPRKYYALTDKGRRVLNELDGTWDEISRGVQCVRGGQALR